MTCEIYMKRTGVFGTSYGNAMEVLKSRNMSSTTPESIVIYTNLITLQGRPQCPRGLVRYGTTVGRVAKLHKTQSLSPMSRNREYCL